jgi:tRNA-guanine family transglycosylase
MARSAILTTRKGVIQFPAYVPVTTFGAKYPLDGLIRPYLERLAPAVMVSYHYAREMEQLPPLPLLVDSGGFASLFKGARLVKSGQLTSLEYEGVSGVERLEPAPVLEFQERTADVAFTLDFPIPPSSSTEESVERQRATVQNAFWALENRRRRDLVLFACVQGWDAESFGACARELATAPFDGFAIGGLVPRARDLGLLRQIVCKVREAVGDRPVHVFGIGQPDLVSLVFQAGADSVDSSSYVKLAADGRLWADPEFRLPNASPAERLHLALCNLAAATARTLPLSASNLVFRTHVLSTNQSSRQAGNEGLVSSK